MRLITITTILKYQLLLFFIQSLGAMDMLLPILTLVHSVLQLRWTLVEMAGQILCHGHSDLTSLVSLWSVFPQPAHPLHDAPD